MRTAALRNKLDFYRAKLREQERAVDQASALEILYELQIQDLENEILLREIAREVEREVKAGPDPEVWVGFTSHAGIHASPGMVAEIDSRRLLRWACSEHEFNSVRPRPGRVRHPWDEDLQHCLRERWRPMSTAPRDGTVVELRTRNDTVATASWQTRGHRRSVWREYPGVYIREDWLSGWRPISDPEPEKPERGPIDVNEDRWQSEITCASCGAQVGTISH